MSSIDVELASELRGIRTDPIRGVEKLRQDFGGFERRRTDELYGFIARVVGIHRRIADDDVAGAAFVALCEKNNQKSTLVKKNLLLAVFKYVLRAGRRGPMYERARIYSCAMKAAVDARTDPADIPDLIRRANGIEELYAQQVGKADEQVVANMDAAFPSDDWEDEEDEEDGDEDDEDTPSGQSGQELGRSKRARPSSIPISNTPANKSGRTENKAKIFFDEMVDLAITFPSSKDLFNFLESDADGGTILFSLRRDGDAPPKAMAIEWTLDE